MAFAVPPLPWDDGALAPAIDARTLALQLAIHRDYAARLTGAVAAHPALAGKPVEPLLAKPGDLPAPIRDEVMLAGGGYANHQFFWKVVQPGGATAPSSALGDEIARLFGGANALSAAFAEAALAQVGSGWAFLITSPEGEGLEVLTLADENSVLPLGKPGLICCDLWEHAYLLSHGTGRRAWLDAFWGLINWTTIGARFDAIRSGDTRSLGGPVH